MLFCLKCTILLDTRREKDLLGTFISDLVLQLLSFVAENEWRNIKQRQAEEIAAAKAKGVKFGPAPMPLPEGFHEAYQLWKHKKKTISEAAEMCGMARSTFYNKAKKYKKTSS